MSDITFYLFRLPPNNNNFNWKSKLLVFSEINVVPIIYKGPILITYVRNRIYEYALYYIVLYQLVLSIICIAYICAINEHQNE